MKFDREKVLNFITYLMWVFIFVVGIMDLFIVPIRSVIWFGFLFLLVIIYFKSRNIPKWNTLFVLFLVILTIFGEHFFELFYTFIYYDKILHFFSGVFLSFFLYFLLRDKIKNKFLLILFLLITSFYLEIIWEIIEYLFDRYFDTIMVGVFQKGANDFFNLGQMTNVVSMIKDTKLDMLFYFFGELVFVVFNFLFFRRKRH